LDLAERQENSFGALGGFTAGQGQSVIRAGIGVSPGDSNFFPFGGSGIGARAIAAGMPEAATGTAYGLQFQFLYGITSKFDVGGILEINGRDIGRDVAIRFLIPARFGFFNNGKVGVSAGAAAGVAVGIGGDTLVTIPIPLDLTLAVRPSRNFTLVAAFEIPLEIWTKGKVNAFIPLVGALGFEYALVPSVKLWCKYRLGHTYSARPETMPAGAGSDIMLGVAVAF
jgi:hypothetical protein